MRASKASFRQYPHQQIERQRLEVRLLLHRGEVEAAALQWEIYQHTQQLEDYRRLVALSSEHDLAVDYRQRACDWLSAQLDKPPEKPRAFAEDLAQLRVEFKPKRNFIKWLNEAFEHSTSG